MTAERSIRNRRVERLPLIVGIVAIALAASLGAVISALDDGRPLAADAAWLAFLVGTRGPFTEGVALFLNSFGGGIVGVVIVPLAIVAILLVIKRPWAALFSVGAALASTLAVQALKHLFGRARPEDILVHSDFGSFPSGHVANAATIAVTFAVLFPRVWVWVVGFAYVLLMAWSRTLLGAHWLSDTVGGALVGAGVVLVVWAFCARWLEVERVGPQQRAQADAA